MKSSKLNVRAAAVASSARCFSSRAWRPAFLALARFLLLVFALVGFVVSDAVSARRLLLMGAAAGIETLVCRPQLPQVMIFRGPSRWSVTDAK
jgi:hypothetical protein